MPLPSYSQEAYEAKIQSTTDAEEIERWVKQAEAFKHLKFDWATKIRLSNGKQSIKHYYKERVENENIKGFAKEISEITTEMCGLNREEL